MLCNVLDLNELPKDKKFSSNSFRSENIDDLKILIENKLKSLNTKDWIQKMEKVL